MRFSHDRRGQSVVIGTVILFGFLILALGVYQVQVVPTDNANVEFDHSQAVEGDFVDVRNSILTAGRTGDARSTSLKLGTTYPGRTFFVNPPPVSGSLSTTEPRALRVTNVSVDADGNAGAYWANRTKGTDEISFDTRSLRYAPEYNELRDGPDLVYEQSLVIAEFDGAVLGRTGQTVVKGEQKQIQLTALDGELSESGVDRRSVDPDPISESRRSLALSGTADPIVVEIPTDVPEEKASDLETAWERRLEDGANVTVAGGTVRIELGGSENYRLALAKVGVGTGATVPDESDGYVTRVPGSDGAAVVEVRDRFNNPVAGAAVEVDVGGNVSTVLTDDDGRASVTPDGSPRVEMSINDGAEEWETVLFRAGTVGSGANDDNINPTGQDQVALNDVGVTNGNTDLQLQFVNQGNENRTFQSVEFTLSYRPQGNSQDSLRIVGPGNRDQTVELRGGFQDLDDPITIPAGERLTITFRFQNNVKDDLIGISFGDDLNRRSLYITPAEGSIDQDDG
jgi:hypothetical protein